MERTRRSEERRRQGDKSSGGKDVVKKKKTKTQWIKDGKDSGSPFWDEDILSLDVCSRTDTPINGLLGCHCPASRVWLC